MPASQGFRPTYFTPPHFTIPFPFSSFPLSSLSPTATIARRPGSLVVLIPIQSNSSEL